MSTNFASDKRAHGFCDRCGFRAALKKMRTLVINEKDTNIKVCPDCWEQDHPQYRIGRIRVVDPQALQFPRPDPALAASREFFVNLLGTGATASTGRVVL
jgi:hypothetical protein